MIRVSVIIPFHQSKRGILRPALESVFAQSCQPPTEIIVVDDGSPVFATDELEALQTPTWSNVRILRQPNAGVSAARNAGLDFASTDSTAIAFLDSDDRWDAKHLERALASLAAGHDLFAGNYRQHFTGEVATSAETLGAAMGDSVAGADDIVEYLGDPIEGSIMGRWPGHISNLVYRREAAPHVRFHPGLSAGEDLLFVMDLRLAGARRVAFCTSICSECGVGDNFWASAGWGTTGAADRVARELKLRKYLFTRFQTDPRWSRPARERLVNARHAMMKVFLHDLRRFQWASVPVFLRASLSDPMLVFAWTGKPSIRSNV